ncbi:PDZ domain-containing protein [Flavihumibacter profundi]|uniref:PDZ domain-containing protein n=1 Tax=Flavihumibacter profundi TaxID=2716883 RepID=UPI001CC4A320|nr:PDZ domain-containing protein [Flavihumibacter profundi]MBZ5858622.1 PDZ domain-containing protein [Flavihumibacter profundi]
MKNIITTIKQPALALAVLLLGTATGFGQQKAKKTEKLDDSQQIIIRWKGDPGADTKGPKGEKGPKGSKDIKLVIELKDDAVLVNGKPLEEFNNDELAVLKKDIMVIDGDHFNIRMPHPPGSPFREGTWSWDNDGNPMQGMMGDPNKPFLGVGSEKSAKGVVVTEITEESAADKAGLKEGDIITKVDATPIGSPEELSKTVGKYKPDDKVTVTVLRDGKEQKFTATLGRRDMPMTFNFPGFNENFKMELHDGQPKLGIKAQDTEDGKGVKVLDVDDESAAEKAGLKEGDIITSFDGAPVNSVGQLLDISRAARDAKKSSIPFKYLRNNKEQQAELKIPRKLKTAEL